MGTGDLLCPRDHHWVLKCLSGEARPVSGTWRRVPKWSRLSPPGDTWAGMSPLQQCLWPSISSLLEGPAARGQSVLSLGTKILCPSWYQENMFPSISFPQWICFSAADPASLLLCACSKNGHAKPLWPHSSTLCTRTNDNHQAPLPRYRR